MKMPLSFGVLCSEANLILQSDNVCVCFGKFVLIQADSEFIKPLENMLNRL
jgi:hypothetical protein